MILNEGFLKKYKSLRTQKPSIYNIEELYYKVVQLTLRPDGTLWLDSTPLQNEDIILTTFPEFIDSSSNLNLIKSVHFDYDISLNTSLGFKNKVDSEAARLIHAGDNLGSLIDSSTKSLTDINLSAIPPDLCRLYLGYTGTITTNFKTDLRNLDSLCSKQIVDMGLECFSWVDVTEDSEEKPVTPKTSVCKFKVEINLEVLREWITNQFSREVIEDLCIALESYDGLGINIILHPPYISRMSFKNSLKIIYPLKTTKVKVIDKVSFRTNKSYVVNNKVYEISFIDKTTLKIIYKFDSINNAELFSNMSQKKDTSKINSYLNESVQTFEDGVIVEFRVPVPIQMVLSKNNNYKIRIDSRDLTTRERG